MLFCAVMGVVSVGCAEAAQSCNGASPPKAALGGGRVGPLKWSASTFSAAVSRSSHRPCLQLDTSLVHPEDLEIPVDEVACGPVQPIPLNIAVFDGLERPAVTFLIMAFPRKAASVSLYFKGRMRDRTISLKLLSPAKARKTGLAPFRYFSLAFSGPSCLSRYVTHSRSGSVLLDGEHMACSFKAPRRRARGAFAAGTAMPNPSS
jgi:hypothetical protein